MKIVARVTIGPSAYTHHLDKQIEIEVPEADVIDPERLKKTLKVAERNLTDLLRGVDAGQVAVTIASKKLRESIEKELKAEMEEKVKDSWKYTSEIEELKKEIAKRDCRMDGIIKSQNPEYVPPTEDIEPFDLEKSSE